MTDLSFDQVNLLNDDYKVHNITFDLIDRDYTVNDDWATDPEYEVDMKYALHRGTYADLNFYILSSYGETPDNDYSVGSCTYPSSDGYNLSFAYIDGCQFHARSLPGGNLERGNLGKITTHGVGHWFGLLDVYFGRSCSGDGDFVSDTPQQSDRTHECPTTADSCPDQEGLDSIHNYMDYSWDEW